MRNTRKIKVEENHYTIGNTKYICYGLFADDQELGISQGQMWVTKEDVHWLTSNYPACIKHLETDQESGLIKLTWFGTLIGE